MKRIRGTLSSYSASNHFIDILNMTYVVTTFYKRRNKELAEIDPDTYANKISYVSLSYLKEASKKTKEGQEGEEVIEKGSSDRFIIDNVPNFSLEKVLDR